PHLASVGYGSAIVFKKKLQSIRSSGNPGGFDYQRHCAFQGIYYQVYLKTTEYKILPRGKVNPFREFVFRTRTKIITILQHYIPGDKESGLAEALLIGYKEDLDKNLVQSYSNTGVVHIIAVSGLHVGLIYWLINGILHFLNNIRKLRFLKPVSIIAALWIFCFLAGGSPSVLRSAVMFTFIVLGQNISRKISIYNSLAGSAFFLLCYNPFWLWDTGFQLSYAAVLSIIVFMKPIYNSLFIENKMLDAVWKLNSVTLSAQLLTIPMCLLYFHQFPIFFLITNFIAVPLSSIILIGELLLCAVGGLPVIATKVGWLLKWLIWLMNSFIERFDRLPFSILQNIQLSTLQVISIYLIITGLAIWIMEKKAIAFAVALVAVLIFGVIRSHSLWIVKYQRKLIVYNIPFTQSIDFIEGNKYFFKGDSALTVEGFAQNFHLKPSRTAYHLAYNDPLPSLIYNEDCYMFNSRRVMVVERSLPEINEKEKIDIDVIVISKSPKLSIVDLNNRVTCKQIVVDASNPSWKCSKWKVECNALGIPCHVVSEKGAFVMSMN
ncbi:MAG TPA: ComEC/Rec2 family competence protein, partial [Flavitalea sp.]|nr:ComEC/Rec2 family competence protein [Flavitalea sp.]